MSMIKLILISGLLFFNAKDLYSQQHYDSLKVLLTKTHGNDKADLLNEISHEYLRIQPDTSLRYAFSSKLLSEKLNYKKGLAKAVFLIGYSYHHKAEYSNALLQLKTSLQLFNELNDSLNVSECLYVFGRVYIAKSQYNLGWTHFLKSLKIKEKIGDPKGIGSIYSSLGIIFDATGQNDRALDYQLRALKIREEIKDLKGTSYSLNNIGKIYENLGNYDTAFEYYERSLVIKERLNDQKGIAVSYNNIGSIFTSKKKYKDAIEHYEKSLEIKKRISDKSGMGNTLINIGNMYKAQNNFDKALQFYKDALLIKEEIGDKWGVSNSLLSIGNIYIDLKNYARAEDYISKGLKSAKEIGAIQYLKKGFEYLSLLNSHKGNYESALDYYKQFHSIKDSIFNEETASKIAEFQTQYAIEKSEKENVLLRRDLTVKEHEVVQHKNLIIIVFAFSAILLAFAYYRFKEKNKLINQIAKHEEELETLNAELSEKNKQLTELNSTKDLFFSIIAHDLKNPFNSILGFSQLIMQNVKELSKDEIQKCASSINNSAINTYHLLENLLHWAHDQTGALKVEKEKFDLHEVVMENCRLFANSAIEKKIELHNKVNKDSFSFADKSMISTVIRNLINNAVKFTNSGEILISSTKKEDLIEISVTDSGIGIEPEKVDILFESGSQFTTNGTAGEKGTGLGLVLCKKFVEKNNGIIKVESKIGKGSKFTFTLPIK